MNSTQALILLRDLDQAYSSFEQLEEARIDLLPERGRFNTIQASIKTSTRPLLRALGGPPALDQFRPGPAPPPERWWWYLNEIVAAQNKALLRRLGIGLAFIALLIGGTVVAFNTVLAPSPEAIIGFEVETAANVAIEEGNYRAALAAVDEGLVKLPGDPGLLLYKGVLHQSLGQTDQANQTFDEAQARLDDSIEFYIARSQLYLRLNQPEQAEIDARAAMELDESMARAWLLLGQSLQLQGREFDAIPVYETAGQLALESGENEIVVLARLALGQIGAAP